MPTSTIVVDGEPTDPTRLPDVGFSLVRGDYFKAMGIPLEGGRLFDARDRPDGQGTVIVNRAAARAFFPNANALGRRVRLGPFADAPWIVVIGVVGDTRQQTLDLPPAPMVYANHAQNTWWRSLALVVRTTGDPRAAESLLRRAVRAADPTLALRDLRTLDDVVGSSLATRRFARSLVSCLAGVALLLAAVGIYGVLAFSVASRTREFGVRIALGATTRGVLWLVLRQGMAWSLIGVAVGLFGAAEAGRLLAGLLYAVTPADVWTFSSVAIAVLIVVAVACLVPATRATRVDPLTSMRAD